MLWNSIGLLSHLRSTISLLASCQHHDAETFITTSAFQMTSLPLFMVLIALPMLMGSQKVAMENTCRIRQDNKRKNPGDGKCILGFRETINIKKFGFQKQ